MFIDILAVFIVTLICPLFFSSTSVHGLPTSSSSTLQFIHNHHTSTNYSPTLRLAHHHPIPSVDYDLGGDLTEMLIGESNELSPTDDDISSSLDVSNGPLKISPYPFSRKFLLSLNNEKEETTHEKRSNPSSLPTQFNHLHSAFINPSHTNNVINLNQLNEAGRLSPSLKTLVETNPFARAWLTMLLQKVMEEQPVPYIFKYGRRRKK